MKNLKLFNARWRKTNEYFTYIVIGVAVWDIVLLFCWLKGGV